MTDRTEEALRDTLEQRASTPPPLPDLLVAVETRRQNHRRRVRTVLLSAAAVVVITGSIAAAVTLTSESDQPTTPTNRHPNTSPTSSPTSAKQPHDQGIPFLPLTAAAPAANPWPGTSSRTPICTARDLQLHVIAQRTLGNTAQIQLAAQSITTHTCRLDRNTLTLGIATGYTSPLLNVDTGGIQPAWDPARSPRVDPGSSVLLNGGWSNWCGPHLSAVHPVLRPTAAIRISSPDTITPPGCDHVAGTESHAGAELDTIAAAGSPLSLGPVIHAPPTARAGTLHYSITLTNPTDSPVSLHPCPVYNEAIGNLGIGDARHRTTATYRLNCQAIHQVAARAHVTFAMQIPIKTSYVGHTVTLGWTFSQALPAIQLGGSTGTLHYTTIRVTR